MENSAKGDILMKMSGERNYLYMGLTAFAVIAATVVLIFAFFRYDLIVSIVSFIIKMLAPVAYGLIIAYLLNPIVKFCEKVLGKIFLKKPKKPESAKKVLTGFSIFLAFLFALIIIAAIVLMIVPQLIQNITFFINNLSGYYQTATEFIDKFFRENKEFYAGSSELLDTVYNYLRNFLTDTVIPKLTDVAGDVTAGLIEAVNFLYNLAMSITVSLYMLISRNKLLAQCKKVIYSLFSRYHANRINYAAHYVNSVFSRYIIGRIVNSLIVGAICFVLMSILRMPYALMLSVVVGITDFIPVIGPWIGAVPSALILLLVDPLKALEFVIMIILLQLFDGNFLGAKISGKATGIDSFWVVFAILVFGALFGFAGVVVGVPIMAVLYTYLGHLINRGLKRKNLSPYTADYADLAKIERNGDYIYEFEDETPQQVKEKMTENKE